MHTLLTLLDLFAQPVVTTVIATHGLTTSLVALTAVFDPSAGRRQEARTTLALLLGQDRTTP